MAKQVMPGNTKKYHKAITELATGPEKLFCFMGAATKFGFASCQYLMENHNK
jgi:hypothetical protein